MAVVIKNPPTNGGDLRDANAIPGSGRSPGGGHGNPLQYSCLENPMDGGAWRATVHRIAELDMAEVTACTNNNLPSHPHYIFSFDLLKLVLFLPQFMYMSRL